MAALEDSAPFKALEALDRNVFRHAEQPLAELFNPDSWRDVDWSFRMGGNPNTKYGRQLDKRQASFEELVGRQPTYMENLDIGQDETPFLAQLLAGLGVGAATGGASFSPRIAASAPTIGRNLRQLGQLQGGNVGQLQNLGGRAVEGIGRAAQPFAKVDFALDDFTKEALQGVRSGGRRLFSGFGGGAPQPTSIATMPTGLADIPALAEPPNISQAQPLVSPGVQPGAGVVPATPTTAAPSPETPIPQTSPSGITTVATPSHSVIPAEDPLFETVFGRLNAEVGGETMTEVNNGRLPANVALLIPEVSSDPIAQRSFLRELVNANDAEELTPTAADNLMYAVQRRDAGAVEDVGDVAWRERATVHQGLRETIAGQVDLEAAGINPQVLDSLVLEDGPVAEYLDALAVTVKETAEETGKSRAVVAAPLIREAAAYLTEKMPDYAQDGGDALRRDLVKRGILEGASGPDIEDLTPENILAKQEQRHAVEAQQQDEFGVTPESYTDIEDGADEALDNFAGDLAESDEEYYRIVEEFKVAQGSGYPWGGTGSGTCRTSNVPRFPATRRPCKSWWALPPKS